MTDELGKMPEATTDEPQLHPGGVDSIDDPRYGATPGPPIAADAHPEDNPAMSGVAPAEISQPDDKQQEPDHDAASGSADDGDSEPEPPA